MQTLVNPSPNFESRGGVPVDMLVLHYTGMPTAESALEKLCDPTPGNRVSAHYLVAEDGRVFQLVPEEMSAWHAGKSSWRGATDINARSIGIEIANPGDAPFPPVQMQSVTALCQDILSRHAIPAWNVVGHSDVAPDRKVDPGERFDWPALAAAGVGLWPGKRSGILDVFSESFSWVKRVLGVESENAPRLRPGMERLDVVSLQENLAAFGYDVAQNGRFDATTEHAVIAFQRHFRPAAIDGAWDGECDRLLESLLEMAPNVTEPRSAIIPPKEHPRLSEGIFNMSR